MSAQAQKSIFLLGGTGYLGSAVLSKFLTLNAQHTYTVLTRSEEKAKMIDDLLPGRVKAAQGSHQDLDLIEKLASENDITFNCADSDDVSHTSKAYRAVAYRSWHLAAPTPLARPYKGHFEGNVQP
jgi:nucleoside-diphosphate-sugar epimerase